MKKVPNLYFWKNSFEYIGEQGVQAYQNTSTNYPYHLGPSDSPEGWQFKTAFAESPMRLSAGTWHVNRTMTLKRDNLQIIGSGYHTVMQVNSSKANVSSGIFAITGDNVLIEGVRFEGGVAGTSGLISASRAINLTIRNCWFTSSGATNLFYGNHADTLTIENCVFTQTKASSDAVYILDSDDVMVKNNRVTATRNHINLDSTNTAVAADRCDQGVVVANHVGVSGVIRYNTSGNHRVLANNASATLTAY
tara:strand:+ start:154 stop:903 length:750 start_codon:yes stop_codon:yes gene_type:complete